MSTGKQAFARDSESELLDIRTRLRAVSRFTIDPPPWWSRRWVPIVLVLLVLSMPGGWEANWQVGHCGMRWGSNAADLLVSAGAECIGVSDGSFPFADYAGIRSQIVTAFDEVMHRSGAEPSSLTRVGQTIAAQNAEAEGDHLANPARPYFTIAYLAALSTTARPPDPLISEREGLEGVAVAQRRQLDKNGDHDPLVRVMIASAGDRMMHGQQLAPMLKSMRDGGAAGAPLVGVVGLDQSRTPTVKTIRALNDAGLPMVAATLSADSLVDESVRYYQVSPQNIREAMVAAAYADTVLSGRPTYIARSVEIIHSSDPQDTYDQNLSLDVRSEFGKRGFSVVEHRYGDDAREVGRGACGFRGLVFFAGRPDLFGSFLDGVDAQCQSSPPVILGGDDISRYAADKAQRGRYALIPFSYLSFAIAKPTCKGATTDLDRGLARLFGFECTDRDPSLDGHAALAYDAARVMIAAVQQLRDWGRSPITAGDVWRAIGDIHLEGDSGIVEFRAPDGRVGQVPIDKSIEILNVSNGQVESVLADFCGHPTLPSRYKACPSS